MKNNLVFLILGILIFRYMAVNPTLFEKEHFVNAAPGLSDTIAVYSNDIDWNNSEKYILSAAEKLDVDVKRIINPSELSEYKIILNLGGHEAYTDENMPTNISKDYLSSEDKLELKSSEFAKLVKVVEKPFWRRDQKLIIFAGNARDDTALVPQGNYDEPKSDKWDNISEVLLGTNPLITEYELLLKVFFDYNGNGEYNPDVGEHPLSDVILKVGEANCKTDEEGNCKMYAPHGRNNMEIKASKKFRYILPSVSEVIPIEDGLDILLNKNTTKNVGLAEGLLLKVFFDYNGNGEYDPDVGEHPLSDVTLKIDELNCKSNKEGNCMVVYTPGEKDKLGKSKIEINAPDNFRYILPSVSEVIPIEDGMDILLNKDMTKNVPLAEGFLTLPFRGNFKIDRMYDHAPGERILWWDGDHECASDDYFCYAVPPGTNEHPGIDYRMKIGEPILAAGPGIVHRIDEDCKAIIIKHSITIEGRPIYTQYTHLSEILVKKGDRINRGDLIGKSGSTCTPYSHLHFALMSAPNNPEYWAFLDPYKPIVEVPKGFWLSGYPLPQWTTEYHPANNINWWTVFNDPQNPY